MPTASTVSKSTTATKPVRKTRTRKARTTKPTPTVKTVTVAKVSTPKTSKSQTRTLKAIKRPSASKLITPQRYWSDIKTRWAIHNYEITMLVSDFSKVVTFVTPYHTQLVKQVKAWTV
tara:strand:- start:1469 stop:1822 length:354 start_codon:yes stop_codon:yes gene_type:complete